MFDLFKKKEQPKENNQESKIISEPYLGDLNKTAEIYNLIKIPHSERDENWNTSFLSHLSSASFRCGDPQVITGPDGLPYFQLFLPEPNTSFQCYVIEKMKDDFLLEHGYGVVINPTGNQPDWILSYGDSIPFIFKKASIIFRVANGNISSEGCPIITFSASLITSSVITFENGVSS